MTEKPEDFGPDLIANMPNYLLTIRPTNMMEFTALRAIPDYIQLRTLIEGPIEVIPRFETFEHRQCVAFCHEEGKLEGLQKNPMAQRYWERAVGHPIDDDYLVGTIVLVVGSPEFLSDL
jgi:hypothetical protein